MLGGCQYRRDDQAGTIRWYVYDGLGSVLGEVAPDGTLTRRQSFDVNGYVRTSAGTATSRHRYVGSLGHPSEEDAGLVYMRARWMDPATGRFTSEDPARDGSNWFGYADACPAVLTDASGHSSGTQLEVEVATGESASLSAAGDATLGVLKGKAEEIALLLVSKYAALGELVAAGYAKNQVFAWQFRDVAGKIHLFRFNTARGELLHTSEGQNLGIPHSTKFVEIINELWEMFGP